MIQEQTLARKLTRVKRREKPPEPPDWNTLGNILWFVLIIATVLRDVLRLFRFLPNQDSPVDTAINIMFLGAAVVSIADLFNLERAFKKYTGWKKLINSSRWVWGWLLVYILVFATRKYFVG